MNHKNNRRVTMTKLLLKESLLDMLETENIHQISIRALCEKADINRSTFYKYYGSQYDLLAEMENELLLEVDKHMKNSIYDGNPSTFFKISLLNILQVTKKNQRLCKLLLQSNVDPEFPKRLMSLASILRKLDDLAPGNDLDAIELSYFYDCILYAGYQMIKRWVEEDCVIPEQQMLQIIEKAYKKLLV